MITAVWELSRGLPGAVKPGARRAGVLGGSVTEL